MAWQAVIVTGASKGFGKAVAISYAKLVESPLHFVLSGRNQSDLEKTRQDILSTRRDLSAATVCDLVVADLSDVTKLAQVSLDIFEKPFSAEERIYHKIVFVNNAGSLGPLNFIGSVADLSVDLVTAINLNVSACCYLTSELVRRANNKKWACSKYSVVNVSSLCAVQPFESWGIYCAGKAARDMFHAVLAQEQLKQPSAGGAISVLNYAPGPLDTDMQKEIRESPTVHKETQEFFIGMKSRDELVATTDSADKLVRLLEKDGLYTSGAHVDFFDKIDGI